MRIRLDKYQEEHSRTQLWSVIMLGLGGVGVVLSSGVVLLGVLILAAPVGSSVKGDPSLATDAGIFLIVGGGIPLIGSALLIWRAVVRRVRFAKLRDLAAYARVKPIFSREEMAQALSLGIFEAERLFLDAVTRQIVIAGPEDYETRPPVAAAPVSAAPALTPAPPTAHPLAATVATSSARPVSSDRPASSAPPMSLGPGTVLGGAYRIESELGAGGMGKVYAASHVRTGRPYAVKTILPSGELSPELIRRFEREALAASALGHPNIIGVHDFNREGDLHYMVMDLLTGETLEHRLGRLGSLDWPSAQRIALDLCSGLAAAHDAGLLHRDIKPANVFIATTKGAPERAVLLDFGLVKSIGDVNQSRITQTGAAIGTPMYMSPEQARGETVDIRTDVYSVGALVYEMVTGAPPFIDRTLAAIYARILTESVVRASKVATRRLPPAVDGILDRALAKDPRARFASVRELSAAIAELDDKAPGTLRIA
jgi:hypothetical protein